MILAFIAFVFSMLLFICCCLLSIRLVDKHLSLNSAQPLFWLVRLAIICIYGYCCRSYPALYLSSFNPVTVLKGTFLAGKGALPRHILVVAQFVISILLISATIIVYQQIQHVKNRDIGYDPNNLNHAAIIA